jgi:tetratricopeptide (TPR) repeat protein
MDHLHFGNFPESLSLLNTAEKAIKDHEEKTPGKNKYLLAVTYNNFGCYYKKTGNPKEAL